MMTYKEIQKYVQEYIYKLEQIYNVTIEYSYGIPDFGTVLFKIYSYKGKVPYRDQIRFYREDYFHVIECGTDPIELILDDFRKYLANTLTPYKDDFSKKNTFYPIQCPCCGANIKVGQSKCDYCLTEFWGSNNE